MAWPTSLRPVARWIRTPALWVARSGWGFSEVIHTGRRSGREYHTPVRAIAAGDTVIIGANFGVDADWVRNVLAAASAQVRMGDEVFRVTDPRLVRTAEVSAQLPPITRFILRRLARTQQCLVARR